MFKRQNVLHMLPAVFLLIGPILSVSTADARLGIVDPCNSTASSPGGCVMVCPAGDGENLSDDGATITVTVNDGVGNPIAYIPASDFWLIGCADGLVLCGGSASSNADGPTDDNGITTISGTIAAGGYDGGLEVVVQGVLIGCPVICLPITVPSVDISGDLAVTLIDFAMFAQSYPPQPYDPSCDFNCDGLVDLVDFSKFAFHFYDPCEGNEHQCNP
ncbi:MAG: hypothetical protein JSW58_04360 [Candidatus Latescibacterota bacterium]|nr:MAG: hypothetical protein JSW58_04360 [Candidatus Latescibacterota bacterium]